MKNFIIVCSIAASMAGCGRNDGGGATGADTESSTGSSETGTVSDKNDSPIGKTGKDTNATGPGTRGGTGSATGTPSSDPAVGSPEKSP